MRGYAKKSWRATTGAVRLVAVSETSMFTTCNDAARSVTIPRLI